MRGFSAGSQRLRACDAYVRFAVPSDFEGAIVIVAIMAGGIAVAPAKRMVTRFERDKRQAPGTIWLLLFGAFLVIGFFFLIEEHRAHVLGALPYVLGIAALLFCIFGHRHAGTWRTHDDDDHGGHR